MQDYSQWEKEKNKFILNYRSYLYSMVKHLANGEHEIIIECDQEKLKAIEKELLLQMENQLINRAAYVKSKESINMANALENISNDIIMLFINNMILIDNVGSFNVIYGVLFFISCVFDSAFNFNELLNSKMLLNDLKKNMLFFKNKELLSKFNNKEFIEKIKTTFHKPKEIDSVGYDDNQEIPLLNINSIDNIPYKYLKMILDYMEKNREQEMVLKPANR